MAAYNLPEHSLRPAVREGSQLAGVRFTEQDWKALHDRGHANLLLHVTTERPVPDSLQAYLFQGIRRGVPDRYKCRVRKPWYEVPHVYQADAFLTYMSGLDPKLLANEASAVAPNTLHVVRLHAGCRVRALELAALWQTSLTALSSEMEGHSLGGGMLKLEPGEARRVAIALPEVEPGALTDLAGELDQLLRGGRAEEARELADAAILRRGLGLSQADIRQLREGHLQLRSRRLNR